ncbi:hypothetical protein HZI73_11620 [Vallitalea pronyensis]|uniref:ABC3 transporter permease C-terminal domain-containing protein n=1 Tax=Vallitalea pronyensis TaxID=1348613 RepID=A0A8J8MJN9_9FIRM|nr:FtsX-like permease family protein [Vallitalea pronyensis]QUI22895.1 hypothetical protein HZI73_11620 [Vallitalea pronyensis]
MKNVCLFFNRNFKKFIGVMFSLMTFLLILNLVLGIVLSVYDNMKMGIVDNNSLYFMEVYNEDDPMRIPHELKENLENYHGVEEAFWDASHPVKLLSHDLHNLDMTNIFGVSTQALKYFKIDADAVDDDFIFLSQSLQHNDKFSQLTIGDKLYMKDYKYIKEGDTWTSSEYLIERTFYGFVDSDDLSMFNNNLSLIHEDMSQEIAMGMTKTGEPYFSRLIVIVPEVNKLADISDVIKQESPSLKTRYILETTGNLPRFAVIIVTISVFVMFILFLISTLSVSSNLNQIFNLRKRDMVLFDIFGVEEVKVMRMFMAELFLYGLLTFFATSLITTILFYGFKVFLGFDILTNYQYIYYIVNFILSVGILNINGFIKLKRLLNTKNTMAYYKEVLK